MQPSTLKLTPNCLAIVIKGPEKNLNKVVQCVTCIGDNPVVNCSATYTGKLNINHNAVWKVTKELAMPCFETHIEKPKMVYVEYYPAEGLLPISGPDALSMEEFKKEQEDFNELKGLKAIQERYPDTIKNPFTGEDGPTIKIK